MFQHQLDQQNKSIAKRISDALAGLVPRRATVTRPDRNGVWVRFDTEGASAPESWFVSTVSGVTAGTSGWVIALGGGKGLFVATGIPRPAVQTRGAYQTVTISSAGVYPISNAAASVTGLTPGATRVIVVTTYFRASGSSTPNAFFGMQVVANGSTSFEYIVNTTNIPANSIQSAVNGRTVTVGADGTISAVPAVQWVSGTITVTWALTVIQIL